MNLLHLTESMSSVNEAVAELEESEESAQEEAAEEGEANLVSESSCYFPEPPRDSFTRKETMKLGFYIDEPYASLLCFKRLVRLYF